ncbi:MAG: metallophosphoesterase [candidate division KSB1 bacterium]|nr:metallophosphoesterase [candidate division KSB1 bacterium]
MKTLHAIWLIVLSAALFTILGIVESTGVQIRQVNIQSPKLKSNREVRLLHLTDLHLAHLGRHEQRLLALLSKQSYDAVLITGDFLKNRKLLENPDSPPAQQALATVEQFVSALKAPLGVFACRGNNDFSNDKEKSDILMERLERSGVKVLVNEAAPIAEGAVTFLGVDFPWFSRTEVADFAVVECEGNRVLQAKSSSKNSYSHKLIEGERSKWRDYRYSGKFRLSQPERGGIGFIFYSQFDRGWDRFYRLRIRAGQAEFCFSHHGAEAEGQCFPCRLVGNRWYRFLVECRTEAAGAVMRGKVWPDGEAEPDWLVAVVETSAAFQGGTVGVWSAGEGLHQFDDLRVVSCSGDTLMYEDFSATVTGGDPYSWVDYNYEEQILPWLVDSLPDSTVAVLLAHSPDAVVYADAARVDIQLSGHTHGGQVCLPFIGALEAPLALGRRYAQGLFHYGNVMLYVNRGIGSGDLPLRLYCRPEAAIIVLKPMSSANYEDSETGKGF